MFFCIQKGIPVDIFIYENKEELGASAAKQAASIIRSAIQKRDEANIILATGVSQFEVLAHLVKSEELDWKKVSMFHLDEYIGLPYIHPASFRKYLKERFVDKIRTLRHVYFVNGETENPETECNRLGKIIRQHPIDIALIGIGENGHLAFNDPPADFETEEPYIVVNLDETCRRQQLGEGWFRSLEDVPTRAISMSIKQIMKSKNIITSVPDTRKASAVKAALEGELTNICPASILRQHPQCLILLDEASASLLSKRK